jgi:hypothetical protein
MKLILTVFVVSVLLAGVMATASAAEVMDLSTINKKPTLEPVALPQVSPNMPTIAATSLQGNVKKKVLDLSTLGKKASLNVTTDMIKGSSPITITPMFSIRNANVTTTIASTVFTLPLGISANPSVYTPPIAIFGGA